MVLVLAPLDRILVRDLLPGGYPLAVEVHAVPNVLGKLRVLGQHGLHDDLKLAVVHLDHQALVSEARDEHLLDRPVLFAWQVLEVRVGGGQAARHSAGAIQLVVDDVVPRLNARQHARQVPVLVLSDIVRARLFHDAGEALALLDERGLVVGQHGEFVVAGLVHRVPGGVHVLGRGAGIGLDDLRKRVRELVHLGLEVALDRDAARLDLALLLAGQEPGHALGRDLGRVGRDLAAVGQDHARDRLFRVRRLARIVQDRHAPLVLERPAEQDGGQVPGIRPGEPKLRRDVGWDVLA